MLYGSLGMHANTLRNCSCCFFSISVHITCCMTSTNSYGTACSSLLSEIHTSLFLGMHALLQQMMSLFSTRPLSCSLLFSQQECLSSSCSLNKNASTSYFLALGISPRASWPLTKISSTSSSYPRMGVPTCLNQPHEEGEEFSNLTTEIRLDGWLRFGVSSLTLTLIIKLSFNLHLTN